MPLADLQLNRFQRWYFGWAEQHYARMAPALRADVERIDRFLYSRRGLVVWGGLVAAMLATIVVMVALDLPWPIAVAAASTLCIGLPFGALAAWLQPDRFSVSRVARTLIAVVGMGYFGALIGFLVGRFERHGSLRVETLGQALGAAAWQATPILLAGMLVYLLLMTGVAQLRRFQLTRQLAQMSLLQERDAAARQAAEARLQLLQAQIQPHFLFNTLAALQHWVDVGDARAAPLLRSLTSFLRGSTELMMKPEVTLGEECAMAEHYLAIMQARLGDRLRWRVDIAPACASQVLPPGLLTTLIENAIGHGIEPQLRGGEVHIVARMDGDTFDLRVLDDGAGLGGAAVTDGVGLANSRERLRHQFGARASLSLSARDDGPGAQACLRLVRTD